MRQVDDFSFSRSSLRELNYTYSAGVYLQNLLAFGQNFASVYHVEQWSEHINVICCDLYGRNNNWPLNNGPPEYPIGRRCLEVD